MRRAVNYSEDAMPKGVLPAAPPLPNLPGYQQGAQLNATLVGIAAVCVNLRVSAASPSTSPLPAYGSTHQAHPLLACAATTWPHQAKGQDTEVCVWLPHGGGPNGKSSSLGQGGEGWPECTRKHAIVPRREPGSIHTGMHMRPPTYPPRHYPSHHHIYTCMHAHACVHIAHT